MITNAQNEWIKIRSRMPKELTNLEREDWPPLEPDPMRLFVLASCDYLVQIFLTDDKDMVDLFVHRLDVDADGIWATDLTREELQNIKREAGFGEWYGSELYPPDSEATVGWKPRRLMLLNNDTTD